MKLNKSLLIVFFYFEQKKTSKYSLAISFLKWISMCLCSLCKLTGSTSAYLWPKYLSTLCMGIYLAIACFDVVGGSSSSHGHTDTETVAFSTVLISSSHGHTAQDELVANVVSKISGNNLVASLWKWPKKKKRTEKNPMHNLFEWMHFKINNNKKRTNIEGKKCNKIYWMYVHCTIGIFSEKKKIEWIKCQNKLKEQMTQGTESIKIFGVIIHNKCANANLWTVWIWKLKIKCKHIFLSTAMEIWQKKKTWTIDMC